MFRRTLQASQRKSRSNARRATARGPSRRRTVLFEPLEPRLLLAADPLTAALMSPPLDDPRADMCVACQEYLSSVDLSQLSQSSCLAGQETATEADALAVPGPDPVASDDLATDPASLLDLPAMVSVSGDTSAFAGQVIYLDVDGASDVTYDGPVRVEVFDVSAFKASGDFAGQEATIVDLVLASLDERVSKLGASVTASRPEAGVEHSTIYVGGDDAAF